MVERIKEEVREHERYLREKRGVSLVLHADDSQLYSVENRETGRRATIAFDGLQHQMDVRGEGIHYVLEVTITHYGRPSYDARVRVLGSGHSDSGQDVDCCARRD